jgi:riboflavin-specific deaminase-like protein
VRRLLLSPPDEVLEEVYADLRLPAASGRPWVALGMVTSVDGAASRDGRTSELGGEADHHAFRALRDAADAVLVGAGTVREEDYGPGTGTEARRRRRVAKGLAPAPRLVVVSGSLTLEPAARVFGDREHPPLVVTTEEAARSERGRQLGEVAELITAGEAELDLAAALDALHRRGLERVVCEGGPSLNAALLAAGLVDELFLTVDPLLVGTDAPRIVGTTPTFDPRRLELAELREHRGELLLRYRIATAGG